MENYSKGKNVEEPLERDGIPIPNLPRDFLWMQVRGGSKIRSLVSHALNEFPQTDSVVWTGFGPAVGKTISCAEIMKREHGGSLYQITKICYRSVEEYWDPKTTELDQLVVKRQLPMIHIFLSKSPLDAEELGYQAPGAALKFESSESDGTKQKPKSAQHSRTPTKEFAALGVDSKKRPRRPNQFNKRKPGKTTPANTSQPDHQSTSTDT